MTTSTSFGTLALFAGTFLGLVAALAATLRTVSSDRPATPPGAPRDWREDALTWDRVQML